AKLKSGEASEFATENKDLLGVQLNYLAGIAWRASGNFDKSYNVFTAAIISLEEGAPLAYDIYIDRGLTQSLNDDHLSAIDDYASALEINENKIDAFLYRAEAFRKLNQHLKARLDLNEALALEPYQPDLLFESGINYRMQKNDEKAVNEWRKLIENYPNTHWEELAEDNINLIQK
ncbi:MAG: tetratricopeptide repeat protein, partial [Kordiimonadaceae bacterium]|nr:tetratricopeptide repeat protein [Kordiimonadaceae bacterium]